MVEPSAGSKMLTVGGVLFGGVLVLPVPLPSLLLPLPVEELPEPVELPFGGNIMLPAGG